METLFNLKNNLKQDPMLNIYYRTQKLKLTGMEILSKNDKNKAEKLVQAIKKYKFSTKSPPHNTYKIINYFPQSFKVELESLDVNKNNSIINLYSLWKIFNLSYELAISED